MTATSFIDQNRDVQDMRATIAALESELNKVKAEGREMAAASL